MVQHIQGSSQPNFKQPKDNGREDDFLPWEVPPPTAPRTDVRVPYVHFALIGLDANGNIRTHTSRSLESHHRSLFTPAFKDNFARHSARDDENRSAFSVNFNQLSGQQEIDLFAPRASRKRLREQPSNCQPSGAAGGRRPKQQKNKSGTFRKKILERIPIEIGNEEKITKYYETAWFAAQQQCCRDIAKACIRLIEPKKQVKHPYNGGGYKDPEKTKADWWPAGVTHREPDHLGKIERVKLLVHIFHRLGKSHNVAADTLEQTCKYEFPKIRGHLRGKADEDVQEILDTVEEVCKVRKVQESYEQGEIDADTVIYVANRDAQCKKAAREEQMSDFGPDTPPGDVEYDSESIEASQPITTQPGQIQSGPPPNIKVSCSPTSERPPSQQHRAFHEEPGMPVFPPSSAAYEPESKPSTQYPFNYYPQNSFVPPVEQAAALGQWATFQQIQPQPQPQPQQPQHRPEAPVFLPVNYGSNSAPQMTMMESANLVQPTSQQPHAMPPTTTSHETLNYPAMPDAGSQSAEFNFMSPVMSAPSQFRTGSLSHPHLVGAQTATLPYRPTEGDMQEA